MPVSQRMNKGRVSVLKQCGGIESIRPSKEHESTMFDRVSIERPWPVRYYDNREALVSIYDGRGMLW